VSGIERIEAVEAWRPYVTPRLEALYEHIEMCDVMELGRADFEPFDVVLMADVIEHLVKEDGYALLNRIPGSVVISTPRDYFENKAEVAAGIWSESHRSLWSVEEFQAMPRAEVAYVNQYGVVLARLRRI
jgi:hypothetical protein